MKVEKKEAILSDESGNVVSTACTTGALEAVVVWQISFTSRHLCEMGQFSFLQPASFFGRRRGGELAAPAGWLDGTALPVYGRESSAAAETSLGKAATHMGRPLRLPRGGNCVARRLPRRSGSAARRESGPRTPSCSSQ